MLTNDIPSQVYPITFTMEELSVTFCQLNDSWYVCNHCDDSPEEIMIANQPSASNGYGWTICSHDYLNDCRVDNYGYNIYKITNSHSDKYFYLDLRDCNYWTPVYGQDMAIRYEWNSGSGAFYWKPANQSTLIPISQGEVLTIWDMHNEAGPSTYAFGSNYWQNCLVLIPSQTGNHPKIVWGPHPTLTDVVAYRVYRKYGTSEFVPIATTDYDEYYYNDTELTLDFQQGGTNAYYYVKAVVVHESESEATNTVVGDINGQSPEKQIILQNKIYNFQINNYPNPFNPTTIIEYSTPERSNIIIKVYDMLGREVKELVNEIKDEGTYQVKFDAEALSSGVYIYTITASNGNNILFRESKQMILMK